MRKVKLNRSELKVKMSKTMKYNLRDAATNVGQTVGTAVQPKVNYFKK